MSHRLRRGRNTLPLHAVGVAILLVAVAQVLVHEDALGAELYQVTILIAFSAVPFWTGSRLAAAEASTREALTLTRTSLLGGIVLGGMATTFVATLWFGDQSAPEWEFMLSAGWSVGAAGGALVGYNNWRIERSRARQEDLAKRLTVLQRVLRHNLRNELSIIGGATADARSSTDDPAVESKLDVASRHVQEVRRLSDQSQRLTRIWRTDRSVEVNLDERVAQEVDRFRSQFPDVPITLDVAEGTKVRAHPDVAQAIREAMANAAIHNEEVELAVSVRGPGSRDGFATLEVRDTGTGIPQTELDPLWGAGERPLEHTTGLGLWLIYWLVESSSGRLDVETSPSGGTVLTIRLPAA